MSLQSINPATGEAIRAYAESSWEEVSLRLERSHHGFQAWRRTPIETRSSRMRQLATVLRSQRDEFARLMAQEMGKPISQGRGEIDKCAWICEYYAEQTATFLAPEPITTDAAKSFVTFEPLGVILAVMPWNFPFWQVFRAAVPALMAGNTMVLKHASNVCGCALAIEEVFRRAGFPEDVFATLLIGTKLVDKVIAHSAVRAVTLTGSTGAGQAVAAKAGAMLKKTVLELGGSDPYIVLKDADLEVTVETCAASRLINSGQSCIAAKRFIVEEPIRARFEQLLVEQMKKRKIGDPLKEETQVGPLARPDLRDSLHRQVQESLAKGAKLLLGGKIPDGPGAYYPPTVLSQVKKGMPAYEEETFGPVAAIIEVRDEKEAIEVANDSVFGLGAAVFTKDVRRGEEIAAHELEAGACFVNASVHSDPRMPFGGIKQSGYGRELSSIGIREFVNIKAVSIT